MNWIKNSKLIISLFTIVVVAVVLIFYRQWFSVSTLIPTTLLAFFFQSTKEQEKLAKKQIEKIEKEEEQEIFKKMLSFVFDFYQKIDKKNLNSKEKEIREKLDKINLGEYREYYEISERYEIGCFTMENLMHGEVVNKYGNKYNDYTADYDNLVKKLELFSSWSNKKEYKRRRYINILKEELPKILTPDVFDAKKKELK